MVFWLPGLGKLFLFVLLNLQSSLYCLLKQFKLAHFKTGWRKGKHMIQELSYNCSYSMNCNIVLTPSEMIHEQVGKEIHAWIFCHDLSHKYIAISNLFAYNCLHSILLMFCTYWQIFCVLQKLVLGALCYENTIKIALALISRIFLITFMTSFFKTDEGSQ